MSYTLGKFIRDKREEARITGAEMARKLSFSDSFYSNVESGYSSLPLNKAAIIAKELKIKPYIMFAKSLKD